MFIIKTSVLTSGEPWKWLRQRPLFLLYWPGFRHKQEVAYRKEVIFFTAVAWTKTATSTCILRYLMSATGYSVSNNLKKWWGRFVFWKAVVIASSCYQLKGLFLWQPEINLFVPLFLFLEEDQSTGSSIRTSDLPGTWDLDGRSAVRLNWFVIT